MRAFVVFASLVAVNAAHAADASDTWKCQTFEAVGFIRPEGEAERLKPSSINPGSAPFLLSRNLLDHTGKSKGYMAYIIKPFGLVVVGSCERTSNHLACKSHDIELVMTISTLQFWIVRNADSLSKKLADTEFWDADNLNMAPYIGYGNCIPTEKWVPAILTPKKHD